MVVVAWELYLLSVKELYWLLSCNGYNCTMDMIGNVNRCNTHTLYKNITFPS